MRTRLRILVFAYACEPGRGSEPAAGWVWARMLSELAETWVITRANNRAAIEDALRVEGPLNNLRFVYVDLPPYVRRWKRGQRGVRLYYLLWQWAALLTARRLNREHSFHLAWHLTLANVWIGSTACLLKMPFVYGPVGGGVSSPCRLMTTLGTRGMIYELIRAIARISGRHLNPLARMSWMRAKLILVQNNETKRWLPGRHRGKVRIFPNVLLDQKRDSVAGDAESVVLFAARLLPWKGGSIVLRALEKAPNWRLIVCGDGPDSARLSRLASRLDVDTRVDFRGWVARHELLRVMREEASVLLFPSLHDEAGWVVVEAMSSGLPVVCLDRGGPPLLAGPAGRVIRASQSVAAVADELASVLRARLFPSQREALDRARDFEVGERLERLRQELQRAGLLVRTIEAAQT